MGQLGFRIESERGRRRADLEREEDGEGGEEEDAEVALPHLGGGEELWRPPTGGISEREGEESRVYQRRPPLEYEGERRKVREGESEGERRDSAEDMGISPTSYLVVARGIKPRYYYQLSSSAGLYPSLLLWHVPGGHGRDRLVVARVKNPRY